VTAESCACAFPETPETAKSSTAIKLSQAPDPNMICPLGCSGNFRKKKNEKNGKKNE
jgi:hypothetical protein